MLMLIMEGKRFDVNFGGFKNENKENNKTSLFLSVGFCCLFIALRLNGKIEIVFT